MFYESVLATAILFVVVCWASGLRVADVNRLNRGKSQGHCGGEAGVPDGGVVEEDAVQIAGHLGQCEPPIP